MAWIGRNQTPLFTLIKYKIVVFDEVYILFHFNIILITTGCPLLKLKLQTHFLLHLFDANSKVLVWSQFQQFSCTQNSNCFIECLVVKFHVTAFSGSLVFFHTWQLILILPPSRHQILLPVLISVRPTRVPCSASIASCHINRTKRHR